MSQLCSEHREISSQQADHQLELPLGGSSAPSLVPLARARNRKPSVRLPVIAPTLPLRSTFLPVETVPRNRRECPDERPCVHIRCKWHLWRIDSQDRPGRPGLAAVPRDEQGRTLVQPGRAGTQRASTTLYPGWLEMERTCKVRLETSEDGTQVTGIESYPTNRTWRGKPIGTLDLMLSKLQEDELVDVYNDCDKHVARAWLRGDVLELSCVPDALVVTLVRARPMESCGLDLIERYGKMTNEQIGMYLGPGCHRTLVARIVKAGGRKVRDAGWDLRDAVEG